MSWRMFLEGSAHGYVSEMEEMLRSLTFHLDELGCHEIVKNKNLVMRIIY